MLRMWPFFNAHKIYTLQKGLIPSGKREVRRNCDFSECTSTFTIEK